MFTGIIQTVGRIASIDRSPGGMRLRIDAAGWDMAATAIGDSIAVSGCCLTVTELSGSVFSADVSEETLRLTTLGERHVGDPVNLEKALTLQTPLGGHLVSGHVDGIGTVLARGKDGDAETFRIQVPDALARYLAHKGSVCVDGISLTINGVDGPVFDITIIPHTLKVTTLGDRQEGHHVNIEVDLVARYLERLVLGDKAAEPDTGLTRELLAAHGFIR